MEIYFNELSLLPYPQDDSEIYKRIDNFCHLLKMLLSPTKDDIIQPKDYIIRSNDTAANMMVAENISLINFIKRQKRESKFDFLLQCFKRPYIPDDNEHHELYQEQQSTIFEIEKNGMRVHCHGLGCAAIAHTFAIGFNSESFWDKMIFPLIRTNENLVDEMHNVICLSNINHFIHQDFITWSQKNTATNPPISTLSPDQKNIPTFGTHHGNNILRKFAELIVKDQYVDFVISSDEFDRNTSSFIKKIHPDGRILFVLHWHQDGYSILIKTTGLNYYQTEYIAQHLTKKYEGR